MSTLHEEFRTAINDGDERLQQAVDNLTDQIEATRKASEAVSVARMQRLDERIAAARDYNDGIFEEQRRGLIVAEQEREKAAKAIREELIRTIQAGDHALSQHITQQIAQIREALSSAEKLESNRFESVKAMVTGVQREVNIAFAASEKAIEKAEAAYEKRFQSVNAFREQLAEQATQFIPREVFETTVGTLAERVRALELSGSSISGERGLERRTEDRQQPWQIWAAGGVLTVVLALIIFLANVLTG